MEEFRDFDSYSWPSQPGQSVFHKYHQEEAVPGVELQNYTKRVPSEDGTYVIVTTHQEKIEKIKQPPTPEEIAQRKKQDRIAGGILAGVGLAFFSFIGWAIYKDEQRLRAERELEAAKPASGA